MDHRPPLRLSSLPLILLLLKTTSITRLQGDPVTEVEHLECVNDYLFTINCSLSVTPSVNASVSNRTFWLTLTDTEDERKYECLLSETTAGFFCSVKIKRAETFSDFDFYEISFCQSQGSGSENCTLLEEEYEPYHHIKPNAPCCLTVSHSGSRDTFSWKSTYEEHLSHTLLPQQLTYQLWYYKAGDGDGERTHIINSDDTTLSVEEENLEPDTEYVVKLRSCPNMVHYQGQWSDWSSEVLWRTEAAVNAAPADGRVPNLLLALAVVCVVMVMLLVSYGSVRKWRRGTFIPTPAPYFQTLYKDCQGDFKSWVVTQENPADALQAEEALHIDTLVECAEVRDYQYPAAVHLVENRAYSSVDADLLSMQSADGGTAARLLDQRRSVRSLSGYCRSCSPAQDSGCWLCSDTSLEQEASWYCNDYCTLSGLQLAACGAGAHKPAAAKGS
uniref:Interleukin 21 receptor n=1 Tax=Fundulus heteroclitus TaxID=8078 RepID=A0A147AAU8_FUNHE